MLSNVKPRDCVWGYGLSGVGRCSLLSSLVTVDSGSHRVSLSCGVERSLFR